jgi:hypothetical protein
MGHLFRFSSTCYPPNDDNAIERLQSDLSAAAKEQSGTELTSVAIPKLKDGFYVANMLGSTRAKRLTLSPKKSSQMPRIANPYYMATGKRIVKMESNRHGAPQPRPDQVRMMAFALS